MTDQGPRFRLVTGESFLASAPPLLTNNQP